MPRHKRLKRQVAQQGRRYFKDHLWSATKHGILPQVRVYAQYGVELSQPTIRTSDKYIPIHLAASLYSTLPIARRQSTQPREATTPFAIRNQFVHASMPCARRPRLVQRRRTISNAHLGQGLYQLRF